MSWGRPLVSVSVALLVSALSPEAADAAKPRTTERLEELRQQAEEREARGQRLSEQAQGYLEELESIDRELTELRAGLREMRRQEGLAERRLAAAGASLADAERELAAAENDLERRLVALYRSSGTRGLAAVYSARDMQGMLGRQRALASVVAEDARLFESYQVLKSTLELRRREQEALLESLRAARREATQREEEVERTLVERRNLVGLMRARSDQDLRAAAELRDAARRLEEALAAMPAEGPPVEGPGLERGRVPRPVPGPVRAGYGRQVDPQFRTETLRNGIEIEAPPGAEVRAVADGRVLFSGWFRGYGQIIIVDHGAETLTVSGFLDELAVQAAAHVRKGDVIGTVGDTGSLSGPGLYFEIRQRGRPLDPLTWFELSGDDVGPDSAGDPNP